MKLFLIEQLCEGEWMFHSVCVSEIRTILNYPMFKPEEQRDRLRVRRMKSRQEAEQWCDVPELMKIFGVVDIEWELA